MRPWATVLRIAASIYGHPPRILAAKFGESGGCGGGANHSSGVEGGNTGELLERLMDVSDIVVVG